MNIMTLVQSIAYAVHDNAAVQAWATAQYGRSHSVYIGIDERRPPGEDDYPLVHVFPSGKEEGYERETQDHVVGITCGIHDDDLKTDHGKANLTYFESINLLEAFVNLVKAAAVGANLSGLRVDSLSTTYEPVEFFPYLIARMDLKLVHDYSQGDDPFA